MNLVTAIAPATVANVGPGFDVLGFALAEPCVQVTATLTAATGNTVTVSCDDPRIPTDPMKNTASAAALSLLAQLQSTASISLHSTTGIPLGSGLGSSAASAVAAVVAVNQLLGAPLAPEQLLNAALDGEAVVSGARHADNVAPCLLGGFVVIRQHDPADWIRVPTPASLYYSVVHPHCSISTADARRLLPATVSLKEATQQWANVAMLIAALATDDVAHFGRALDDKIVEPVRAKLIPGYNTVKLAALNTGALGCTISGSGPSMIAFSESTATAKKIAAAMVQAFSEAGLKANHWIGTLTNPGARTLP
jgi:homoserine kinase